MVDEGVSSMLVREADGSFGIVTDRDLRSKVVAEGLPIETPVSEVMTAPVTTPNASGGHATDAAARDRGVALADGA